MKLKVTSNKGRAPVCNPTTPVLLAVAALLKALGGKTPASADPNPNPPRRLFKEPKGIGNEQEA
tara:strand:- start:364 stop:555 length:192 start_codon:yes stop_codon:yes gene_type:complete